MNVFDLVDIEGLFRIQPDRIQRQSLTGEHSVVLAPSLTFRKRFEVPADLDREPERVFRELFANYLPGSLDEHVCQFVARGNGEDALDVLGLAAERQTLVSLKKDQGADRPVVLFERLMAEWSTARMTLLDIPFPSGRFYGVSREGLVWSRYLRNPGAQRQKNVLDDVNEQFPDLKEHRTLPDWASGERGADWSRSMLELLPSQIGAGMDLTTKPEATFWERHRLRAWSLLGLTVVLMLVWIGVLHQQRGHIRDRMQRRFQTVLGRASRFPLRELQGRLNELQQNNSYTEIPDKYPRVTRLDRAWQDLELTPKKVRLAQNQAGLLFAVPTLREAERFKQNLLSLPRVQTASIKGTETIAGNWYRVNMTVQWDSNRHAAAP